MGKKWELSFYEKGREPNRFPEEKIIYKRAVHGRALSVPIFKVDPALASIFSIHNIY